MDAAARVQVLIVGAGPTGLTLAIDLARRGISVRIVDRSTGPQPGSRGFGVKPRTLEIFDDLEVAGEFQAANATARRTKVYLGGSLLADFMIKPQRPDLDRPYRDSVSLPQTRTEEILRTALARYSVQVEFGTTLVDLAEADSRVTAELADGGRIEADYLIGCDGGRSTVRKKVGIGFEGSTESAQALLADVDVTGLPDLAVHLWTGPNQAFVLRPYRQGEPWQAVASFRPGMEPTLEWLQATARERTGLDSLRLTNPRWLSVWRYGLRLATAYRRGRVFLAGDAAHVHSPFGAFGMNTGVQDAYNLGWKLALVLDGADDALLDTYQAERLPVGRAILQESDRRFTTSTAPPRLLRPFLRYLVKPFLVRMNHKGADDHPRYPASPLTVSSGRKRPQAGDIAPDGACRTSDGRTVRLFDLFRGVHFTVLSFGRSLPPLTGPVRGYRVGDDLVDIGGNLRRSYPRSGFVLIRPDNYIALLTDDSAKLINYLHRWGGS